MALYLGIDLSSSEKKPSGCAVLDGSAALLHVGRLSTDAAILALAEAHQPRLAAIDAPLFYPKGWHCLEWPCPQGICPPPEGALRAAERELYRQGISLYATTKKSFIKPMIYRAIGLRACLEAMSIKVIEIYPYASKVQLFGKPVPKKATAAGCQWLRERLEGLVPGLREREGRLSHDELDAVVAAYTAYLYGRGLAEEVGDAEEGVIVVPRPDGRPPGWAATGRSA
ncbi:MAG: DUF429 domain-containing protein [Chloroflexota bacterium]|nr:DUF429 domain-containing protein [Chloroflexota bacterium]